MRVGEKDGVDYNFVGVETFRQMISAGEFVEWAEVHGNFYGTAIRTLNEAQRSGQDILLDIDFQGAAQLKKLGVNAVFIFIAPPSIAELEKRLHGRGTDSTDVVAGRIENAHAEIAQACWYDYIIVNDSIDRALADLQAVICAERCRGKLILPWLTQQFQI
jgi:guanylate kinase